MARHKGSKNSKSIVRPPTSRLSTEERIEVLANLIVDRILEDKEAGGGLLASARKADDDVRSA